MSERSLEVFPFFGRERELEELAAALKSLFDGHGQIVCVVGEPGIGKTRLAEKLAAEAQKSGCKALWGNVWEESNGPPYWPFIQIIRDLIRETTQADLAGVLHPIARELLGLPAEDAGASTVQRSSGGLPVLPMRTGSNSEDARFVLFDSVATFLKRIAVATPLILILDDIHSADIGSLMLLRFLTREISRSRIMLVATYRDLDPQLSAERRSILDSIATRSLAIHLRGLERPDILSLIKARDPSLAENHFADSLLEATEGNPLFVNEVIRLLGAGAKSPGRGARRKIPVPQTVRETLENRLLPCSSDAKTALEVAALVGKTFDVQFISDVLGKPVGEVLNALEELRSFGLVRGFEDRLNRYSFVHDMFRETVIDHIGLERRAQLNLKIAAMLEASYGDPGGSALGQIAAHYISSLPLGSWKKAVDLSRKAAVFARKSLAYEQAAELLQAAADAVPEYSSNQEESCELLIELADVLAFVDRFEQQQEVCARAVALARTTGRRDLLARAAVSMGIRYGTAGAEILGLISLLEEALGSVSQSDFSLQAMLKAKLAATLYWSRDSRRSVMLSGDAVNAARRANDPTTLIYSLWRHHYALWEPGNVATRLAIVQELIDLSEKAGTQLWTLRAYEMLIADCWEVGHLERAEQARNTYTELLHRLGTSDPVLDLISAMTTIMRGDFATGEKDAQEALASAQRAEHPGALLSYASQIAMIRFQQGRLGELEPIFKTYVDQFPLLDILRCGLALSYVQGRRESEARREFEHLTRDEFNSLRRDWNWLGTMAVLAEISVFLRDKDRAAKIYELMSPYANLIIMVGWFEVCYGAVDHYLGKLATLLDRNDEAREHFEAAISRHLQIGATTWLHHSQYAYAEMLFNAASNSADQRIRELNEAVLSGADLLGMQPLGTNARDLKKRINAGLSSLPTIASDREPAGLSHAHGPLLTVFFVDVVESTKLAETLGNRKWKDLLGRFYIAVRSNLARFDGREIQNPGDGFLAAFNRPLNAINAAWHIRDAVRESGLNIRAGLHAGECEQIGDQIVGIVVHIGARVAAAAQPGDILVSRTVRELVAGSSVSFSEAGFHTFKGVSGEWQLYRVDSMHS